MQGEGEGLIITFQTMYEDKECENGIFYNSLIFNSCFCVNEQMYVMFILIFFKLFESVGGDILRVCSAEMNIDCDYSEGACSNL